MNARNLRTYSAIFYVVVVVISAILPFIFPSTPLTVWLAVYTIEAEGLGFLGLGVIEEYHFLLRLRKKRLRSLGFKFSTPNIMGLS